MRRAARLANWRIAGKDEQIYADIAMVDLLLTPPAQAWSSVRRQVLLPLDVRPTGQGNPLAELEDTAVQWAREILEKSPTAIRFIKAAFNVATEGLAGMQQFAGDATLLYYLTDEAKEGKNAFLEKRKPDFSKYPRFP